VYMSDVQSRLRSSRLDEQKRQLTCIYLEGNSRSKSYKVTELYCYRHAFVNDFDQLLLFYPGITGVMLSKLL
jgi:hypothetical protein